MSENSTKKSMKKIDKARQRELQANLINHIAQVYFYFAEENEEIETDEDLNNFIEFMWDIAVLTSGALGLRVVGETVDGKIVAELKPTSSVKKFMIELGIGEDDDSAWEEIEDNEYNNLEAVEIEWEGFEFVIDE